MRVMKFGGTSLSTSERLATVCDLVSEAREREPVVVVASAVAGATNTLLDWVGQQPEGLSTAVNPLVRLEDIHTELFEGPGANSFRNGLELILAELDGIFSRSSQRGRWHPALKDHVVSAGERLSAHLLTSLLKNRGIEATLLDATCLIRTDSTFGCAEVDFATTRKLIRRAVGSLPPGQVAVVAGFTGADDHGRTTILGRGASDLTATLVAAAAGARVAEIWTDVDGIHAEDPQITPTSPVFSHISFTEARHMAQKGARVLHPRTIDPIEPLGIPLRVRNTFHPDAPGTLVGPPVASSPRRVADPPASIQLILAGATGKVAGALLDQIEDIPQIRVAGAFTSRQQVLNSEGIPAHALKGALEAGGEPSWNQVLEHLRDGGLANPIFVDCTASREVAGRYAEVLEAGIPLVTANKIALSGDLDSYHRLQDTAARDGIPFKYETTVGAALPILGAFKERKLAQDGILEIEAVLSGTLSFVFSRLREGVAFSQAVREAFEAGLTEPDPREDLAGSDVGRKLLILLREGGYGLEPEAIPVESLVPAELSKAKDTQAFLDGLSAFDSEWEDRIFHARDRAEVLAYTASFDGTKGTVGVRNLPADHHLARLQARENLILIHSGLYDAPPLSIGGPGAGTEITASGVLSDLLAGVRDAYGLALPPASPSSLLRRGPPSGKRRRVA